MVKIVIFFLIIKLMNLSVIIHTPVISLRTLIDKENFITKLYVKICK